MERELYQEKSDFIRYEDEDRIIIVAPAEWIIIKKNKDTEEKEELGRFKKFEEAKKEVLKIISEKESD